MSQARSGYTQQVGEAVSRIWTFVFGSFFRFMILLGIIFHAVGLFWADGIEAGHLAIYGSTAIAIGVLGWVVVWWKIQDDY